MESLKEIQSDLSATREGSQKTEVRDVVDISGGRLPLAKCKPPSAHSGGKWKRGKAAEMHIYDNRFFLLPSGVEKLQSLTVLKLFSNRIQLLPDEDAGQLKKLQELCVKLPEQGIDLLPDLGDLKGLQVLNLHRRPLKPSSSRLPKQIGTLSSLRRLAVTHYAITCIPPEISGLTNLEEIDLSFNRISSIPPEFGSLAKLRVVRLASNKISSPLPAELERLVSLETLILCHNNLTTLEPVDLFKLVSLTSLDLQFNKLRANFESPSWMTCLLEGNELLTDDSFGLDLLERLPDQRSLSLPACSTEDGAGNDNETDSLPPSADLAEPEAVEPRGTSPIRKRDRPQDSDFDAWEASAEVERGPKKSEIVDQKDVVNMEAGELDEVVEEGKDLEDVDVSIDEASQRDAANVIPPPQRKDDVCIEDAPLPIEASIPETSGSEKFGKEDAAVESGAASEEEGQGSISESEDESGIEEEEGMKLGRKHGRRRDRNPKPSKRRKAVLESSPVSEKYHRESLCGVEDRLHDGFYDPGRERPFLPLEEFEREAPCLHSREVILVDRAQDEELDVIAASARALLSRLPSPHTAEHSARALALFVSDCFGGSDRSEDLVNLRRTTLGIIPERTPLSRGLTSASFSGGDSLSAQTAAALPSLRALCEEAVRFLKQRRGSNVIPVGALPVGICRHRAILFKYLCDRARPPIPCELVRGYLDYEPHAWNVVLVKEKAGERRLLVDACRPGRIQNEGEGDVRWRYLPLKRIDIERQKGVSVGGESEIVLHEEIGRGASSAVVRRCTIDPVTVAAKVVSSEALSGSSSNSATGQNLAPPVPQGLSELRMLYSLSPHPNIVQCFGHLIRTVGRPRRRGGGSHELLLFLEHIQSGSLEAFLRRRSDQGLEAPLPPPLAVQIALGLARGLEFVYSQGVIHRDVKSGNLLVEVPPGEKPRVKLCDFSSAVLEGSSSADGGVDMTLGGTPPADVCVGTPRWMAPDVLRAMYGRHPYGREADIWSFGCVVLEMLTLAPPYSGLSEAQVHSCIQIGRRPDLPSDLQHLRPKAAHFDLNGLLTSLPGEDDEAFCLRVLVGVFCACTNGDAALRPLASEVAALLGKVEAKLDENAAVGEEAPTGRMDSEGDGLCVEEGSLETSEISERPLKERKSEVLGLQSALKADVKEDKAADKTDDVNTTPA